MYYDRKIRYLDYCERGQRIRGGGYVKLEAREESLCLELAVTGLHPTDSFEREVFLRGDGSEKAVGKIQIAQGTGRCRQHWTGLGNLGGTGISYGELCGIRIPLGAGREVSCSWTMQGERNGQRRDAPGKGIGEDGEAGFERRSRRENPVEAELGSGDGGDEFEGTGLVRGSGREESGEAGVSCRSGKEDSAEMEPGHGDGREESGETGLGRRSDREEYTDVRLGRRPNKKEAVQGDTGYRAERKTAIFHGQETVNRTFGSPIGGKENQREEYSVRAANGEDRLGQHRETGLTGEDGTKEPNAGRKVIHVTGETEGAELRTFRTDQWTVKNRQNGADPRRTPVKLSEEKWPQLWAIYPHIRPFDDTREYISIGPSDFVLFPEAVYKKVNNSFLLHGYYNYHHLLLARVERKGEALYYIGVPGNFFEKEKQVAIMFGFESFECAEEPAQAGDFGYYMMRVGL